MIEIILGLALGAGLYTLFKKRREYLEDREFQRMLDKRRKDLFRDQD